MCLDIYLMTTHVLFLAPACGVFPHVGALRPAWLAGRSPNRPCRTGWSWFCWMLVLPVVLWLDRCWLIPWLWLHHRMHQCSQRSGTGFPPASAVQGIGAMKCADPHNVESEYPIGVWSMWVPCAPLQGILWCLLWFPAWFRALDQRIDHGSCLGLHETASDTGRAFHQQCEPRDDSHDTGWVLQVCDVYTDKIKIKMEWSGVWSLAFETSF